ncbi:MAG TPA: GNAT family N-acetyltransferase [Devosia sp.]|nr:GNAT family N-acetyltransferase [Devosia sp.]
MAGEPIVLSVPLQSDLGRLALELRRRVFVDEQRVPLDIERDEHDAAATHVVALLEGNVAGVMRIVFLPQHAKFGRVAVDRAYRRRGIAQAMMQFAMALARERGETRFYLTSQLDKVALYEKLGFIAFGERFEEGGLPHRAMKTY